MSHVQPTYPTDLKYSEWQVLEPLLPTSTGGRPRKWALCHIVNAIFYVTRTGGAWRMLPQDFPPWQTVYGYFRRWTCSGLWEQLNAALVKQVRVKRGRHPKPSAGIIDSQSVKTSEGGQERRDRCVQTDAWAQASHRGGHLGTALDRRGPQRRDS